MQQKVMFNFVWKHIDCLKMRKRCNYDLGWSIIEAHLEILAEHYHLPARYTQLSTSLNFDWQQVLRVLNVLLCLPPYPSQHTSSDSPN